MTDFEMDQGNIEPTGRCGRGRTAMTFTAPSFGVYSIGDQPKVHHALADS